MKQKQLILATLLTAMTTASAHNTITYEDKTVYRLVHQTEGPTLGYSPASGVR